MQVSRRRLGIYLRAWNCWCRGDLVQATHVCMLAVVPQACAPTAFLIATRFTSLTAGEIPENGMNGIADIGLGGPGAGIDAGHSSIADRGEKHGDHRDQYGSDDMTARFLTDNAENWHGRRRLNHDDPVKDQVAERENSPEPSLGRRIKQVAHGQVLLLEPKLFMHTSESPFDLNSVARLLPGLYLKMGWERKSVS
jgi:hypothetical protein